MNAALRIATRASRLALWQAHWVADQLRGLDQRLIIEIVTVKSLGDQDRSTPLASLGGAGIFTKEVQAALIDGRGDIAVHSLKDLPTDETPGLIVAAVPPRESVADVLIARAGQALANLPTSATVGTSSPRRQALLLNARPDLQIQSVRGNVETRLAQVLEGRLDAIVLAQAGLARLNLLEHISQVLEPPGFLPAVGQGALAVECRADDERVRALLANLNDPGAHAAVRAERTLLAVLQGGCSIPLGAWARAGTHGLILDVVALDPLGQVRIDVSVGPQQDPEWLGRLAANELLSRGADRLLKPIRPTK
jgi:hydroxymethylbilane synthase